MAMLQCSRRPRLAPEPSSPVQKRLRLHYAASPAPAELVTKRVVAPTFVHAMRIAGCLIMGFYTSQLSQTLLLCAISKSVRALLLNLDGKEPHFSNVGEGKFIFNQEKLKVPRHVFSAWQGAHLAKLFLSVNLLEDYSLMERIAANRITAAEVAIRFKGLQETRQEMPLVHLLDGVQKLSLNFPELSQAQLDEEDKNMASEALREGFLKVWEKNSNLEVLDLVCPWSWMSGSNGSRFKDGLGFRRSLLAAVRAYSLPKLRSFSLTGYEHKEDLHELLSALSAHSQGLEEISLEGCLIFTTDVGELLLSQPSLRVLCMDESGVSGTERLQLPANRELSLTEVTFWKGETMMGTMSEIVRRSPRLEVLLEVQADALGAAAGTEYKWLRMVSIANFEPANLSQVSGFLRAAPHLKELELRQKGTGVGVSNQELQRLLQGLKGIVDLSLEDFTQVNEFSYILQLPLLQRLELNTFPNLRNRHAEELLLNDDLLHKLRTMDYVRFFSCEGVTERFKCKLQEQMRYAGSVY